MSEPIHIISLGAGVQSSTMALMAAKGEITPMPVAAIFADTQDEPDSVYRWLDWLEKQLPFPVHRVSRGSLMEESFCKKCPFHSDAEWLDQKRNRPSDFAESVQFERDLQRVKAQTDKMNGVPFLHASLKPLDEVDFSTEEERGQLNMFNNECEGICGV